MEEKTDNIQLKSTQIENKLNEIFKEDSNNRHIVFWYDANQDFLEDIENLKLDNVKTHIMTTENQLATKVLLEREDMNSNYLIYSPAKRPSNEMNHLLDINGYSREFVADRIQLLMLELNITQNLRPIFTQYTKFFENKERINKFKQLYQPDQSGKTIEWTMLATIAKSNIINFHTILMDIMMSDNIEEILQQYQRYNLTEAFWTNVANSFGYGSKNPSIYEFTKSLFATYANSTMNENIPIDWKAYVLSNNTGSVITFMDMIMNNKQSREQYRVLADKVGESLKIDNVVKSSNIEDLINSFIFKEYDEQIITWILDRLAHEDYAAKVENKSIPEICQMRRRMHYVDEYRPHYHLLENAYYLLIQVSYREKTTMKELIDSYISEDYKVDNYYRRFYYNFDLLNYLEKFRPLRQRVENAYKNSYLDVITKNWHQTYDNNELINNYPIQKNFYNQYMANSKNRVVVIISDAFRYELGKHLYEEVIQDPNLEGEISPMIATFPSTTPLGMASLLPHKEIELSDDGSKVLIDNMPTDGLVNRQKILQNRKSNSMAIQFDTVNSYTRAQLRDCFKGQDVIYIYHNQIDTRAEKEASVHEVFNASQEAVTEIYQLIKRLAINSVGLNFIVTADHGYIYKRDKLPEAEKIDLSKLDYILKDKRFVLSNQSSNQPGVKNYPAKETLSSLDNRMIQTPLTSNIFKSAGGSQNYVHGGSSPQERIVPVIEIKFTKGHAETQNAPLTLISRLDRIANLNQNIEILQQQPISDVVKEATYRIGFETETGMSISNNLIFKADSTSEDSRDRISKLSFIIDNRQYDPDEKYFFVARNIDNPDETAIKQEVIFDPILITKN